MYYHMYCVQVHTIKFFNMLFTSLEDESLLLK